MNLLDKIIIAVLIVSVMLGFIRGFVKSLVTLITLFLAFEAALHFSGGVNVLLSHYLSEPKLARFLSYGVVFITVVISGALLNTALGVVIKSSGLKIIDRLLGTIFGLLRGCLAIYFLIYTLLQTPIAHSSIMTESKIVKHLQPVILRICLSFPKLADNVQKSFKNSASLYEFQSLFSLD